MEQIIPFSELEPFFLSSFPKELKRETTFLDIINRQTKENTISAIYAHFLDWRNSDKIAELFLSSLQELIKEKSTKDFNLVDYTVYTEYITKENKGRIDIVIESKESKSVIIIENKIYHYLGNDLVNYWDTFAYKSENKVGIVLGLTNIPTSNDNFISITHLEWVTKIEKFIKEDNFSIREKIHIEDFISNIKHVTNENIMNENIKFYLNHSEKIEQAIRFKDETAKFVIAAINKTALHFGWEMYGNTLNYKQIWDKEKDIRIFYTLFPDDIIKKRELKIVIEIDGNARAYYDQLVEVLEKEHFFEGEFKKSNDKNIFYAHVGYKCFPNIEDVKFDILDSHLIETINELESTRTTIINKLEELGYQNIKQDIKQCQ